MSTLTTIFTVCTVLCILAPNAFSIDCYISETEHTDSCEYCFYFNGNVSAEDGRNISATLYSCLTDLSYGGLNLDPSDVNRCVDVKKNDSLEISSEQYYVCDKDLCNADCTSIECYLNKTEPVAGCKYCLYANFAGSIDGQSGSQSIYDCLQQLSYEDQTIPTDDVNKCFDQDVGNGKANVYVCDKDLCNVEHCDGIRVSFSIVAIITIVASAILHF